jgi:hypothetical protein
VKFQDEATTRFLQKLNGQSTPLQDIPPQEGREDRHGLHPVWCVRLVKATGDQWAVPYGAVVSSLAFNPSHGISFVFEGIHAAEWGHWKEGSWSVTIRGSELSDIFAHLCEAKEVFVREGENVTGIEIRALPQGKVGGNTSRS